MNGHISGVLYKKTSIFFMAYLEDILCKQTFFFIKRWLFGSDPGSKIKILRLYVDLMG